MAREDATHWVVVPITPEVRQSGNPDHLQNVFPQVRKEFRKQGRIVEGPWFVGWQDGDKILSDGATFHGPGAIFYAVLEENVSTTPDDSTEESS